MKYLKSFFVLYATKVGALWGLVEAYTYFGEDKLREALGIYWLGIYILPALSSLVIVLLSRNKNANDYQDHNIGITTNGDYSPGKVGGNYTLSIGMRNNENE